MNLPATKETAYGDFLRAFPAYEGTHVLDELRAAEYGRLDAQQQVYLDYTGGSLYADFQVRAHMELLANSVFGNPHSGNPASLAMTKLVERARAYVLTFFNASPDEYMVIFTQNATAALKLVGESYTFGANGHLLLTFDNHNSVNGIREYAHAAGATVTYVPVVPPEMRVDAGMLRAGLEKTNPAAGNLFAFPAQSNFSGVQHPLAWIAEAQAAGWDVLLDASAFTPTNRLDLGVWKPDFVALSFYKMFGYPTGVGCLIARRTSAQKLKRPWYAGGTIVFASVLVEGHHLAQGPAGFEDGTMNYLSLPAVEIGLRHIEQIGIDVIHERVTCLTGWLLEQLAGLRHSNGRPLIEIYGPRNTDSRGATVEVNYFDAGGCMIDCLRVEALANSQNISLRAGCHCNPGAREVALGVGEAELAACYSDTDETYEQVLARIEGRTEGAVRASFGLVSTFDDAYRYVKFAEGLIDKHSP